MLAASQSQSHINSEYSNWVGRAVQAYNAKGEPNFLDAKGELVEGIYLDLPNEVYHGLNALSSSGLKTFVSCPARYFREYLSGITRKRTLALTRTFDAGTYGHELCLEPAGFYDRYFREPIAADHPDALTTVEQIEAALLEAGLPAKEGKSEKLARLLRIDPSVDKTTIKTIADIDNELTRLNASKTESKLDKAIRLVEKNPNAEVFDLIAEQTRHSHGPMELKPHPETGKEVATYGGKLPIDGVVWDDAHRVQKTVRKHKEANLYISNGLPEVAIIARCNITGMMLKVKFDWLRFDDDGIDLKTSAQSVKPEDFRRQVQNLHYDIQQVFYCYVASIAGINIRKFVFVTCEYGTADICQPYVLSRNHVIKANNTMHQALIEFKKCRETDNWYGYTKEDSTIELI
ncbi:PD-(D/E)XK nuclease-like domain-containing protein [Rheinheimera sp.]|uniref:PD-(D/E)XK nuclease-like domain-containing protein n=1 Tax=Rheinheimera sp. TaxID=1869214 RepID=UPI0040482882